MILTHDEISNALARAKGLSDLPDHRVRQLVEESVREVEANPIEGDPTSVERVLMLATAKIRREARCP